MGDKNEVPCNDFASSQNAWQLVRLCVSVGDILHCDRSACTNRQYSLLNLEDSIATFALVVLVKVGGYIERFAYD